MLIFAYQKPLIASCFNVNGLNSFYFLSELLWTFIIELWTFMNNVYLGLSSTHVTVYVILNELYSFYFMCVYLRLFEEEESNIYKTLINK